ncbi:13E12 repeat family protein [Mycolicibacterium pyrenivorans]|uniref:13E12 repeat family protein n=1 Tax=Mycolicibacterium pyrenivorans TaxID=187102 RepID=UPI0027E23FE4|nr:13E12 repeat family protein [Mycolicibacterium pyrenivorans]MCV7150323.1 DUF222 domain-containing protein [Mycolicibacterium pyrenivorans]
MSEVSSAIEAIKSQLAVLGEMCDELTHRELVGLLAELTAAVWSVPTLEHRILNRLAAETEPSALGESSWKEVLATALRISTKDAGARLEQAANLGPRRAMTGQVLAPRWEAAAAAQAAGLIGPEHVEIIAKFHKDLPSWVDVGTREVADTQLAQLAAGVGPAELDAAAGQLLMMIDQDGPEPSEKEQARKRGLTLGPQRRDGTCGVRGTLTAQARAVVEAVLAKLAAPGMSLPEDETAGPDLRTQAQRNHDALVAMGQMALMSGDLGKHNGLPVTVIATATVQDLEKGAGLAVTGGGTRLPIRTLIRMAARAYHYLYIYDKHTSESLYLGRTKRLASAAQRIVLHARDRGCIWAARSGWRQPRSGSCSMPGTGVARDQAAPRRATGARLIMRSPIGRTTATPISTS